MRNLTMAERIRIGSTVKMLEEALEVLGNGLVQEMQHEILTKTEEESIEYLKELSDNIYKKITVVSQNLEIEYEAFKADPETQKAVQEMMDQLADLGAMEIEYNDEGASNDDDEGNGNLQ